MTSFLQRARGAAGSFSYCAYEKEISLQTPRLCKKTIGKGDKKMKSKKAVRSALGMSVLSIALCAAMLIGTTFAWFTDTASTAVNKIQAGTLKVDIVGKEGSLDGKILSFKNKNGETDILWEPGATFNLDSFKIVNNGNLALKYKVVVSGVNGSSKLLEAIEFKVKVGEKAPVALADLDGILLPEGKSAVTDSEKVKESDLITISGHMKETAGNEYQGLSIDGVAITVYATQYTYEYDSEGKDYDKDATFYPVIDLAGLKDALAVGGNVSVNADVTVSNTDDLASRTIIKVPTTLNLEKKILSPDDMGNNNTNFTALIVAADTTINAGPEGGIDTGKNGAYAINVMSGAKLVINGGSYYGGGTAIQVQKGELEINGGFFAVEPYDNPAYGNKFLLNCVDAAFKDGTAKISVKGGTFVNYDPSDSASENPVANFVADGYSVVSEKHGNDTWYTVVKGAGVLPGTQDDLNKGITDAEQKDVTVVMPKNSSFTLDNNIANEGAKSRDITFVGDGTQTVDVASNAPAAEGAGHLNYQRGSTFTFKNLTIENGTNTYDGIVCDELVYENCTIKGVTTLYGKATFINCTFENTMANQYSIWTWGGTDVTFDGCTFNTNGKAILLFGEEKTTNLTVDNCTFNDRKAGASGKAAIEVGEANYGKHNNFTVVINNITVNGHAKGQNTDSAIWANKNNMGSDYLTVTIDGVKVELQ